MHNPAEHLSTFNVLYHHSYAPAAPAAAMLHHRLPPVVHTPIFPPFAALHHHSYAVAVLAATVPYHGQQPVMHTTAQLYLHFYYLKIAPSPTCSSSARSCRASSWAAPVSSVAMLSADLAASSSITACSALVVASWVLVCASTRNTFQWSQNLPASHFNHPMLSLGGAGLLLLD
eukprot:1157380-Pelagomonas_calceolata.AAC.5